MLPDDPSQLKSKANDRDCILIAEDEADLREFLADEFQLLGYRVLQAGSGAAAQALLATERIDVVLSDIRMPGGGGIELLEWLNAQEGEKPGVFFMTGYSDLTEDQVRASGAKGMFHKPFRITEILATVAVQIRSARSARSSV